MPFDIVNLSRSGSTMAWPAATRDKHLCYGVIYPKDGKGKEWITFKSDYMESWGKFKWDLAA